jgi:hypothetical protein
VNTANGTFAMKTSKDRLVTVQTNADTSFKLRFIGGVAALANLAADAKVLVVGTLSADGSTIIASQVIAKSGDDKGKGENEDENNGFSHGLKNGWKDKNERDNRGMHKGFLSGLVWFGGDR